MQQERSVYSPGISDQELARLLAQTEAYALQSRSLLDQIGVAPGSRVVDVGCGPLGILDLLAERVGPTGEVVGVDSELPIVERGRAILAERNLETVQLVQGDAADTGLTHGTFDLVHERNVLIDVPNPEEIVAEMVSLARPGGIVALQDPDQVSWICDPPNATWDRLIDAVESVLREQGRDVYIGRRLHRLLLGAGLVDVQVQTYAMTWRPGHPNHQVLLTFVELLRDQILEAGMYGEDNLDGDLGVLRVHLERPDSLTIQPLICQAWGRKPG